MNVKVPNSFLTVVQILTVVSVRNDEKEQKRVKNRLLKIKLWFLGNIVCF